MKFWRNLMSNSGQGTLERREKRSESCGRFEPSSAPTRRRSASLKGSTTSLTDDAYGTTFVELIKRAGTHLGVIVTGGRDTGLKPRIADLVPGSWAQRSNVLCVGDIIISLNGLQCQNMMQHQIVEMLDTSDKVQLEVKYRLPPAGPTSRTRPKIIQVTLKKENGSFGFVIRGGGHDIPARVRPFTVVHIDKAGPAQLESTLRPGDRILALNNRSLLGIKLPELQSLLYQQDKETVFTIEYDIAKQTSYEHGAVLIEIYREPGDILGLGLNRCSDTNAVIIESIKQASLADRCGALHVGDILISVGGQPINKMPVDDVSNFIRDQTSNPLQLEVLPGAFARNRGSVRASLPSPCFSTMQRKSRGQNRFSDRRDRLPRQLSHSSLADLQANYKQEKERKKYVSFTVELDRTGGPLGITLSTKETKTGGTSFLSSSSKTTTSIVISAMMEGGLAQTTKAIQLEDELVEINGVNVKGMNLKEAMPLLQNSGKVVRLKLTRLVVIPERDFQQHHHLTMDGATGNSHQQLLSQQYNSHHYHPHYHHHHHHGHHHLLGNSHHNTLFHTHTKPPSGSQINHSNSFRLPPRPPTSASMASGPPSLVSSSTTTQPASTASSSTSSRCSTPSPPLYAPLLSAPVSSTSTSNRAASPLYSPLSNYRLGQRVTFLNQRSDSMEGQSDMEPSSLPTITLLPRHSPRPSDSGRGVEGSGGATGIAAPLEVTKVSLFKDKVYEDFGFSVSDGLYERGIFVNRIRKGGPADDSGLMKPFDRILQINSTRTTDFDCCLAVPLIAAAGDKIELLLTRPFPEQDPNSGRESRNGQQDGVTSTGQTNKDTAEKGTTSLQSHLHNSSVPWIDETDQESTATVE